MAAGSSKNKSVEEHIAAQRLAKRNKRGGKDSVKKLVPTTVIKDLQAHERFDIIMQANRKPRRNMSARETVQYNLAEAAKQKAEAAAINEKRSQEILMRMRRS